MGRYEEVPERTWDVLEFCIKGWFPELRGAKILLAFDTQLSRSSGRTVLGSIRKANDLHKFLTIEGAQRDITGYDYILILDKVAWTRAGKENRIRIMRHELRHSNIHTSTNPWGLRGHTVEDFYEEIKLNRRDPRWAEELAGTVEAIYAARRKQESIKKKGGFE